MKWYVAGMCISLLMAGLIVGFNIGTSEMKYKAVKNGVAEWVVVNDVGATKFQWITNNVVDVSLD